MRLMIERVLFALICVAFAPAAALAQQIAGVVKDTSGAVLPGVTVEASSPALIERVRTATTDEQGQFRIVDLRPGTYSVMFTLQGFASLKRDGIQLTADFTASINIELNVGSVAETVTVSGQSPLVDVQNVGKQTNISREVIDSVPTNRNILGLGALTVGAILPPTAQDVGGSKGEISTRLALHGGRASEQKLLQDGMPYNSMLGNGNARTIYINPAAAEEFTLTMGGTGGSAEVFSAGIQVNLIPKDGGNRFSGFGFVAGTGSHFQANNLTDALAARGMVITNGVSKIYDFNGAVGGPVMKNKLWFFSAHRYWGNRQRGANLFNPVDVNAFIYTPDFNSPTYSREHERSHAGRLTWQATSKQKITFSEDYQSICICSSQNGTLFQVNQALGAANSLVVPSETLIQMTWTFPVTSRILFEAGSTFFKARFGYPTHDSAADGISVLEQSTGFRYRAPINLNTNVEPPQYNYKFSGSYVTGSHHVKAGLFFQTGHVLTTIFHNDAGVNYTFNNGVPIQLQEYASPVSDREHLKASLGLYLQDQWTARRLTLSYGLRFNYLNSYVPPQEEPAGLLIGARSFAEVRCVPCWKDLDPRVGVAYDLFGTGKTAVKASLGRYVQTQTVGIATSNNPANTSVNSTARMWTDLNRDLVPNCDLRNPEANNECGPMLNKNFGQPTVTTSYDQAVIAGWQHRPYNWQASMRVDHQLLDVVAVSAGYYRTWYGNFTTTDNLSVTPDDFNPYCITAPADSRLPGGGGNQICGLYDLHPSKVGLVRNFVTFSSNYGEQSEIYNGFDFGVSTRLPHGIQASGGVNIGNSSGAPAAGTISSSRSCFVVDSPQQLYQCDQPLPYMTQVKVLGVYPLPWDVKVAATFQSLPGLPILATYNATNAQIAPTLGRNLSSGSTAAISILQPFSQFEGRMNQLDLRLSKTVRIGGTTLRGNVDVYNVTNSSPIAAENFTYGSRWLVPSQILDARLLKVGLQLEF